MHEAAFANAALPKQTAVFGLPLRPYSIAHEIWLASRSNPFVVGGIPDRDRLVEAVMICSHTHAELTRLDADWLLWLKVKAWKFRTRKSDVAYGIEAFRAYQAAGSGEPPTLEARQSGRTESGRAPGAPFALRLLQFLMLVLRLSESDAMAYPFGRAKWHYCAYWESENALRIKNADEISAEEEITAAKLLVAAGMTPGEALETVRMAKGETCQA